MSVLSRYLLASQLLEVGLLGGGLGLKLGDAAHEFVDEGLLLLLQRRRQVRLLIPQPRQLPGQVVRQALLLLQRLERAE